MKKVYWGYGNEKRKNGYGRMYLTDKESGELKAQSTENSIFCMNLADAMKTGSIFYIAAPVLKQSAESMQQYTGHISQTALTSIQSRLEEFKPVPIKGMFQSSLQRPSTMSADILSCAGNGPAKGR